MKSDVVEGLAEFDYGIMLEEYLNKDDISVSVGFVVDLALVADPMLGYGNGRGITLSLQDTEISNCRDILLGCYSDLLTCANFLIRKYSLFNNIPNLTIICYLIFVILAKNIGFKANVQMLVCLWLDFSNVLFLFFPLPKVLNHFVCVSYLMFFF